MSCSHICTGLKTPGDSDLIIFVAGGAAVLYGSWYVFYEYMPKNNCLLHCGVRLSLLKTGPSENLMLGKCGKIEHTETRRK